MLVQLHGAAVAASCFCRFWSSVSQLH